MKRFQKCSRVEKLWRYRFYLFIPLQFLSHTILNLFKSKNIYPFTKGLVLWKILIGCAQIKMKWYYTMEEVMGNIKHKRDEKHNKR